MITGKHDEQCALDSGQRDLHLLYKEIALVVFFDDVCELISEPERANLNATSISQNVHLM